MKATIHIKYPLFGRKLYVYKLRSISRRYNLIYYQSITVVKYYFWKISIMAHKITEFGSFVDNIIYNIFFQPDDELSAKYVKDYLSSNLKVR